MQSDHSRQKFQAACDQLVARGFARTAQVDDTTGHARFVWTTNGVVLQRLLRQLYGVPERKMDTLSQEQLLDPILILLRCVS